MPIERPTTLLAGIGYGDTASEWLKSATDTIAVDSIPSHELKYPKNYIESNVLFLTQLFPQNSIPIIHADFLLNGVIFPGIPKKDNESYDYKKAVESPSCPYDLKMKFYARQSEIREREMHSNQLDSAWSAEFVRMMQDYAVKQLWEVLAPNGQLIITDVNDTNNTGRIIRSKRLANVLNVDENQFAIIIDDPADEDFARSDDLNIKRIEGVPLTKITITKLEPQVNLNRVATMQTAHRRSDMALKTACGRVGIR